MAHVAPLFSEAAVGRYDEMFEADGSVRAHWQAVAQALTSMAPQEYQRRRESALRMVRENGVTYNVYDDAEGLDREWQLDIAPFVLSAGDWHAIEAIVEQRARLAEAILGDVYGEQRLITNGTIPAQLVLGHPQYLRALAGVTPPGGVHLHLYSLDLTRASDGSWFVLSTRADAPTGLGYALENRIVVSQTFPELFGELGVQRLAPFFRHFRDALAGLVADNDGKAVLLTPGPYNEAYFEHAYLARYLGLELVEGDDLVARDGIVYLRTLGGLARVSTIIRRLDSDFADPLELRADSHLGIPGLVDAMRSGNVVVANALGGGVVESPALDAYLPNISRELFGETLRARNVPTIWCGTEWGRKEGLARLAHGIVRNSFDAAPLFSRRSSARLGAELNDVDMAGIADLFARRGATHVLHDIVPHGVAPTFADGAFGARPMSLRVFACWTPQGYRVMPGGLARIAHDESPRPLSMQSGSTSKDVWALASGPIDTFSLLRPSSEPVTIRRSGNEAPSRSMDNLLWLARYAERAENLIRILRAVVLRLAGDTGFNAAIGAADVAQRFLLPMGYVSARAIEDAQAGDDAGLRDDIRARIFEKGANGLQRLLAQVSRTAWAARDRLSLDTWRAIYAFTAWDSQFEPPRTFDGTGARAYLDTLVRSSAALSGQADENMTRGNNWHFFDLGRRIERAFASTHLIRETVGSQIEPESASIQLALEIADSTMTYAYRYHNAYQVAPMIDLLLLDASNPRGVAFQLEALVEHATHLPLVTETQRRRDVLTVAEHLVARIQHATLGELCAVDDDSSRDALRTLLGSIDSDLARVGDALTDAYLQHLPRYRT